MLALYLFVEAMFIHEDQWYFWWSGDFEKTNLVLSGLTNLTRIRSYLRPKAREKVGILLTMTNDIICSKASK